MVSSMVSLNLFIMPIHEGEWKKYFLSLEFKVLSLNLRNIFNWPEKLRQITYFYKVVVSSSIK